MKKVRIFVGALALLAVVGGASAFKAKSSIRLYTLDTANNNCKFSRAVDEGTQNTLQFATLSTATTSTISVTFCDDITDVATFDLD